MRATCDWCCRIVDAEELREDAALGRWLYPRCYASEVEDAAEDEAALYAACLTGA